MKNESRGSITVETCLTVPLFLFFLLAVGELMMLMFAEAHIHQSLVEAADYTAQYCYLEKQTEGKSNPDTKKNTGTVINTVIFIKQFYSCLGEDFYVEKTIRNGKHGIMLSIKQDSENTKVFTVKAKCFARISVPMLGNYDMEISDVVKKKAFVGYEKGEGNEEEYVYVTLNQEVYHLKRSCSHLSVSFREKNESQKKGYTPCSFCSREKSVNGKIYVAKTTNVYHTRKDCSGLKRTVRRVKRKDVGGLGPCQRCGK